MAAITTCISPHRYRRGIINPEVEATSGTRYRMKIISKKHNAEEKKKRETQIPPKNHARLIRHLSCYL